jgi:hypothetical protein
MNEASTAAGKRLDRRIVLKAGAALAMADPVILRGGHAEAQPRTTALFAYVGAFTTPERKGHGGGINVYRVDPTSGAWTKDQLLEVDNPVQQVLVLISPEPGRTTFNVKLKARGRNFPGPTQCFLCVVRSSKLTKRSGQPSIGLWIIGVQRDRVLCR